MNLLVDRETKIVGVGRTQEEALASMRFNIERSGRITPQRAERRKEIHAWLPTSNLLHIKGVGAILYENNHFKNLRTGRTVRVKVKPLSHYLCLYSVFDGKLSYEDFTITVAPQVDLFLRNISDKFLSLNDFPYIKPAETFKIKYYHETVVPGLLLMETYNDTIVVSYNDDYYEVDKVIGVDTECLISYLLSSIGFTYDGMEMRKVDEE